MNWDIYILLVRFCLRNTIIELPHDKTQQNDFALSEDSD